MEKTNVVLYSRTSTPKQDITSQINCLLDECELNDWEIKKSFKDIGVSRLVDNREGLNELINYVKDKTNNIDKIVLFEMSRLSGNLEFATDFIVSMSDINVSIYFYDRQCETLRQNKTLNSNLFLMLTDEIKFANLEVTKVTNRLKRGLKAYKEKGGKVGRKSGSKMSDSARLIKYERELEYYNKGFSLRMINLLTGTSVNAIRRAIDVLKKDESYVEPTKKITTQKIISELTKSKSSDLKNMLDVESFKMK